MPTEIGLWRVGNELTPLPPAKFDLESRLEDLIVRDATTLGLDLMIVARQENAFGKRIDLLAIDADSQLHVLELKRDRTPRDIVAQLLEYGAWADTLTVESIEEMYGRFSPGAESLSAAFSERFGVPLSDELSGAKHKLIVVCSELDVSTDRIVTYLSQRGIPINAVFFRYFQDGASGILARTWFVEPGEADVRATRSSRAGEPWNGVDYYVAFGEGDSRQWEDARRYGFVSAGGGRWYSRTLQVLTPGARIWVCIPNRGYVGVGEVEESAKKVDDFTVVEGGDTRRLLELPLRATSMGMHQDDAEKAEYVVKVKWLQTRSVDDAVWEKGMFANQNSACKLRNRFTLDTLYERFGIEP